MVTDRGSLGNAFASLARNVDLADGTIRKREGSVPAIALNGPILGVHSYQKADGTRILLAKAGAKLYAITDWIATEIASGLSDTGMGVFATVNARAYFCDGANFKVTDGDSLFNVQITAPALGSTSVAVSGAVGAGKMTGTYDYKITWYSSAWGQESAASPQTAAVAPNGQSVALTSLPTTAPDARADMKRIYRRKVSAAETQWRYVAEIAAATTSYTDTSFDNDISLTRAAPFSVTGALPAFKYLCLHDGVLFAAGSDDNTIYYSRAGQPYALDRTLTLGSENDQDPVTALAVFDSFLVVGKERSIWLLAGNSPTSFDRRKIDGIGILGHNSIVHEGDFMYFRGPDDFYVFDGTTPQPMGYARVRGLVETFNRSRRDYCVGVWDKAREALRWAYSSRIAATNDVVMVYFRGNTGRTGERSWCPWGYPSPVTTAARVIDTSTSEQVLLLGFESGALGLDGSDSDGGVPIDFYWVTGEYEGGAPARLKVWDELAVEFEAQSSASLASIGYILDDVPVSGVVLIDTHDQVTPIFRRRVRRSSRKLRLWFSAAGADNPCEVSSWSLEYSVTGRA